MLPGASVCGVYFANPHATCIHYTWVVTTPENFGLFSEPLGIEQDTLRSLTKEGDIKLVVLAKIQAYFWVFSVYTEYKNCQRLPALLQRGVRKVAYSHEGYKPPLLNTSQPYIILMNSKIWT